MPLVHAIRARHYRPRRPVNPIDRKVSRCIIAIIVGFFLIICGAILLIVSASPHDKVARISELIAGAVALAAGVIVAISAGCFYHKFYSIKKEIEQRKSGLHADQNGMTLAVISSGENSLPKPNERYVVIDAGITHYASCQTGKQQQKVRNDIGNDIEETRSVNQNDTEWNVTTASINKGTPPSSKAITTNASPEVLLTTESCGDYAEISDYNYFADESQSQMGLDWSDIASDVVSFKSALDEIPTPPP